MTEIILAQYIQARQCVFDDCTGIYYATGLCVKHTDKFRQLRKKAVNVVPHVHTRKERIMIRFWSKVDKTPGLGPDGECWEWMPKLGTHGYGNFCIEGIAWLAHRASLFLHNGRLIKKLLVLHSCDNKKCVNPWHLRQGTYQNNADDRIERGGQLRGEQIAQSVLTESMVLQVKREIAKGEKSAVIGRRLNVSRVLVGQIKRGETWRWLTS